MLRGLWSAAAGMRAQQQKIDVVANNIANVNTTGFKKKSTGFQDLVYQSVERKGNAVSAAAGAKPVVSGTGSRVAAVRGDFRDGIYTETGSRFDFAVVGDGFFRVALPDGREAYTRDGNFRLDAGGRLVTAQGYRVLFPELPAGDFGLNVAPDGTISVVTGEDEEWEAGRIELAYFNNPEGLEHLGDNLLTAGAAAGEAFVSAPKPGTKIMQGYLESSNVDLSQEMVQLLVSQRAFEVNSRALRTADEMWGLANQLRR